MEGIGVHLHSFLSSAIDGHEQSTPTPGRFIRKMNAATHWIGNWVGPRAGVDLVQTIKISLPCRDSNPLSSSPQSTTKLHFYEKPNISNGAYTKNKQYLRAANTTPRTTLRDTCLWRGACYLCTGKCYFDLTCKSIGTEEPGITNALLCLEFTPMSQSKGKDRLHTKSAYISLRKYYPYFGIYWYAVVQLVEALRYNPKGRGFDSRWCHFSLT